MEQLLGYWHVDVNGLIIIFLLLVARYRVAQLSTQGLGFFVAAILICIICFFSPLSALSGHYLFSAHMAVHVLLLLLVGPLLVLSIPRNNVVFSTFFSWLQQNPLAGWLTGVGIMWLWHIPIVFNYAMAAAPAHFIIGVVESASLVVAGIVFSAPVIHPNKTFRIEALPGVLYLFTACIGCSLLGLLITFAPVGTYQHYMHGHTALSNLLQNQWHISQASDQQAAGLIMWVPCCLVYVSGAMYLLFGWLSSGNELPLQLKET